MLSIARQRVGELVKEGNADAGIYGEKELGGLGLIYVLPEKAAVYGLIENPRLPHARIAGKWLLGVIPGLAILFAIWRRLQKDAPAEAKTGGE
jgi:formate dehydrogenase iron-sulfur subunit